MFYPSSDVSCTDYERSTWFIIAGEGDGSCSENDSRASPMLTACGIQDASNLRLVGGEVMLLATQNVCLNFFLDFA